MTNKSKPKTVCDLIQKLRQKEFSCVELVEQLIQDIEANQALNAIISYNPDLLRKQAILMDADESANADKQSLLKGIPLIIKDNINTQELATTGGTKALANNHPENASVIDELLGHGALIAAKANLHELAFGITSNNAFQGAVHNPHDSNKIPGGSSGGTAAAVAAGIFPAGLGTDTGGSCRIPAALCGIVGFRPSTGRYSQEGLIPLSHSRDTVGSFAHTVEDICLLDQALSQHSKPLPNLQASSIRLGISKSVLFDNLDPEVESAIEASLDLLKKAGVTLIDIDFGDIWQHNEAFSFPVVLYEVMQELPEYLSRYADVSFNEVLEQVQSPDVKGILASQLGEGAMPEAVYQAAIQEHGPKMCDIYNRVFAEHQLDAIVFPTTPLVARSIGEDETVVLNNQSVPTFATYIRNTDLGSNIGVPGISLPCPKVSGLPVGIEFDGLRNKDEHLLALAIEMESILK